MRRKSCVLLMLANQECFFFFFQCLHKNRIARGEHLITEVFRTSSPKPLDIKTTDSQNYQLFQIPFRLLELEYFML